MAVELQRRITLHHKCLRYTGRVGAHVKIAQRKTFEHQHTVTLETHMYVRIFLDYSMLMFKVLRRVIFDRAFCIAKHLLKVEKKYTRLMCYLSDALFGALRWCFS